MIGDAATSDAAHGPRAEYAARHARSIDLLEREERRVGRLANLRLVAFLVLVGVIWAALIAKSISPWWIVLPLVGIWSAVVWFDRAEGSRLRAERLARFYEEGLAKLDDRWVGRGRDGARFGVKDHPYAEDLDLFGRGSLFERVSTARTHAGEARLAAWFLTLADRAEVEERQGAVRELRDRLELREDLAVLGGAVGTGAMFEGLAEWGAAPRELRGGVLRLVALVLATMALPCLGFWLLGGSVVPLLVVVVVEGVFAAFFHKRVSVVLSQVERRTHELGMLEGMLARLERETFEGERLARLHRSLAGDGDLASRRIARLGRLLATLDARRNMILGPISPLLLWGTQVAFAVEAWRARSGGSVGGWLAAIGEIEALLSLASYAYESPDAAFAEVREGMSSEFWAEGLGHPLIPARQVVRNDVRLGGSGGVRLVVVSGSNMSGKSTLLRAVGLAVVMGLAGGVVRARGVRMSPFVMGSTLRVGDSLQDGRSRFYAEIVKLRAIVGLCGGERPLLYLLDEILAGTNSHDRRLGAEAVLSGLVSRGALGLVTTHDLALTEIAKRPESRAENVHFGDELKDGVMTFDYRMRPGVVSHSNALELMRSIGLEV